MLLLTFANYETCFSGTSKPRRAQWSKKVRARQHMTVVMVRGHGLKKGLLIRGLKIAPGKPLGLLKTKGPSRVLRGPKNPLKVPERLSIPDVSKALPERSADHVTLL